MTAETIVLIAVPVVGIASIAAVGIARMYFDHKEAIRRLELEKEQKK